MRIAVLVLLGSLSLAPAASAQRLAVPAFPSFEPPGPPAPQAATEVVRRPEEVSGGSVVTGSIMGGIGGMWIGAFVGSRFASTPCEDCGLVEGLYGAALGFGLGASGGAHLANRQQGSFGASALVTLGLGAAGVLTALATDQWEILLAVPIAQVASAVAIERRSRREQPPI